MIVLALESATDLVGAAVLGEVAPGSAVTETGGRRHAEALAPALQQVCRNAGVPLAALDVIAVDVGPGLFTGLRVGVATAKALAQGLGIGVVGIESLDILAAAAMCQWPAGSQSSGSCPPDEVGLSPRLDSPVCRLLSAVIWSLAFSPDGSRMVASSRDNFARVWEVESRTAVSPPLPHRSRHCLRGSN